MLRSGKTVDTGSVLQADDVLVYRATEAGVRMLWASPRFGLSPQDLYMVSIATNEQSSVRVLEENEDIQVVAAEGDERLRDIPATPGEMCLVTAASPDVLTDHPSIGLWQKVAGKAPQTGKTWVALSILVAVIVAGSLGLVPSNSLRSPGRRYGRHPGADTAVGGARPELEHPRDHRRLGRSGDDRRGQRSRRRSRTRC